MTWQAVGLSAISLTCSFSCRFAWLERHEAPQVLCRKSADWNRDRPLCDGLESALALNGEGEALHITSKVVSRESERDRTSADSRRGDASSSKSILSLTGLGEEVGDGLATTAHYGGVSVHGPQGTEKKKMV